jgi:hypothetical protein
MWSETRKLMMDVPKSRVGGKLGTPETDGQCMIVIRLMERHALEFYQTVRKGWKRCGVTSVVKCCNYQTTNC